MILLLNACMRREWQNEVNFCNKKIRSYLLPRPNGSNTHDNDIFYSIKIIFTFTVYLCSAVNEEKLFQFLSWKHQILTYKKKKNIGFHLFSTMKQPAPNKRFCPEGAQTNP